MLIKHKLIASTFISMISMFAMLVLINFTSSSLEEHIDISKYIGGIKSDILELRRSEKDFMAQKDLKYINKFKEKQASLKSNLIELETHLKDIGIVSNETSVLKNVLDEYQNNFLALVSSQKHIGLNEESGLKNKMRTASHNIEKLIESESFDLKFELLTLRRNEKDFLLRTNERYVTKFNKNAEHFKASLNDSDLLPFQKIQISNTFDTYKHSFLELVAEKRNFGYTPNSGLQNEMRSTIHKVDNLLKNIISKTGEVVKEDKSEIYQIKYSVFFLALFFSVLIAILITLSINKGILTIKSSIVQIAKDQDLTVGVVYTPNDELSEIADSFNLMVKNLQNLISSVDSSVNNVEQSTKLLSQNIIVANKGVQTQLEETDMVATAVNEMSATIDEIANNTSETADKAQESIKNAQSGKSCVEMTISQIDQLSNKLIQSEEVVEQLSTESQTIGTVIDVIRAIADQTNLLALNAAIEAARAGEQGRGFAVVADEVRTLASRTQNSTKQIEDIVNSLQNRTSSIVNLMEECRNEGDETAKKASEAGIILEHINTDIISIMDMTTAIATAVQEQSAVAAEVNQHVVSIRDVTIKSSETSMETSQLSDSLFDGAKILHKEISTFKV